MGSAIWKVDGMYFVWSSVVDAPVTYGLTLEELKEYWKEEYGRSGLESLERSLSRVEEVGTSSYMITDFDELIERNHAGMNGTTLTKEQILIFLRERPDDPPMGKVMVYDNHGDYTLEDP